MNGASQATPDAPPVAPPDVTPEVPRRALSVRTTLVLGSALAFAFVLLAGIALAFRVLPSAQLVAARGKAASLDFAARNGLAARLDSALSDVHRLVDAARSAPMPAESLAVRRLRVEGYARETELLAPLERNDVISPAFSQTLEEADRASAALATALLGAIAALEVRDPDAAARLARRADTLYAPLVARLGEVTRAALVDLARDEEILVRDARFATSLIGTWIIVGVLVAPFLWTLLAHRLFEPLASVDAALRRVETGDLDAELPVRYDDEMGRLAQHFNRTTRELRLQRAVGERAAAQAALEASEARYRAAFEEAAVGLAEVAVDGTVMRINAAMSAILGRTPDAILGRHFAEFTLPADADADRANWDRLITGSAGLGRAEKRFQRPDGRITTAQVTRTLLRHDDGRPRHVLSVVHDVTEQRRLEQELHQSMKLEAVGQLAGGVAHDFNNLLAGIIGYADLLEHEAEHAPEVREDAAAIRRAALRGADLARSLLTLARRNPHRAEPVSLDAIARDTVDLIRRTFDRRIEIGLEIEAPVTVLGDHSLLSNALLNLSVNARDAMPDGGRLRIEVRRGAPDDAFRERHGLPASGDIATVSVADDGHGMSPEVLAHVFEPYFTTKEPGKGTGLGLALVYGTVKDHGGTITVESAPGRGTTMTLHLPCTSPSGGAADGGSAVVLAPETSRVLLVDDDPLVRDVAARMLRHLGYAVDIAEDGVVALERLAQDGHDVRVVILDGNMPRLSGVETARRIRALRPALPLVYASGFVDAPTRDAIRALGCRTYLQKPYTVEALSRAVAECLEVGG